MLLTEIVGSYVNKDEKIERRITDVILSDQQQGVKNQKRGAFEHGLDVQKRKRGALSKRGGTAIDVGRRGKRELP